MFIFILIFLIKWMKSTNLGYESKLRVVKVVKTFSHNAKHTHQVSSSFYHRHMFTVGRVITRWMLPEFQTGNSLSNSSLFYPKSSYNLKYFK